MTLPASPHSDAALRACTFPNDFPIPSARSTYSVPDPPPVPITLLTNSRSQAGFQDEAFGDDDE